MADITITMPDDILDAIPPRPAAVTGGPNLYRDNSRDVPYFDFAVGQDIARVLATDREYNKVAWVDDDGSWGTGISPRFLPTEQRAEVEAYLLAAAAAYATFTGLAGLPQMVATAIMDAAGSGKKG